MRDGLPTPAAPIPADVIAQLVGRLSPAVARGQAAGGGMVASGSSLAGQDLADAAFTGGVVVQQSVANALAERVVTNSEQQMATTMDVFAFDLSNWEEINALPPSGTVSFSQMDVPLFDLAAAAAAAEKIEVDTQADLDSSIAFVISLFGSAAGDYDFSFDADLSAKTYELEFDDINIPSIGISGAKLEQNTGYAGATGFGFIFIEDDGTAFQGLTQLLPPTGIFADAQCKAIGCAGAAVFLNADGNPLAGAAHGLLVGDQFIGGGFAVAD